MDIVVTIFLLLLMLRWLLPLLHWLRTPIPIPSFPFHPVSALATTTGALLGVVGISLTDDFLLSFFLWQGMTVAGYIAFYGSWSKGALPRVAMWQSVADLCFLGGIMLVYADTSLTRFDLLFAANPENPFPRNIVTCGLLLLAPVIKAVAFPVALRWRLPSPSRLTGKSDLILFWLALNLAAVYHVIHIYQQWYPSPRPGNQNVLLGIVTVLAIIFLTRLGNSLRVRNAMSWLYESFLPALGGLVQITDRIIVTGAMELAGLALFTVSDVFISFEEQVLERVTDLFFWPVSKLGSRVQHPRPR